MAIRFIYCFTGFLLAVMATGGTIADETTAALL